MKNTKEVEIINDIEVQRKTKLINIVLNELPTKVITPHTDIFSLSFGKGGNGQFIKVSLKKADLSYSHEIELQKGFISSKTVHFSLTPYEITLIKDLFENIKDLQETKQIDKLLKHLDSI